MSTRARPSCLVALLLLCLTLNGCATIIDTSDLGLRPYGGVRLFATVTDEAFLSAASRRRPYALASKMPGSNRIEWLAPFWPLFLIDLPLSLAVDTVLLPISIPYALSQSD